MHELSLLMNVVEAVEELAARESFRKVHGLTLRVGVLAGVEVPALEFAFPVATAGTILEGAILTTQTVPVLCQCQDCRTDFEPLGTVFRCPRCHGLRAKLIRGQELEIGTLEVS
jgi:hydrogenase nickel incorporation protein HypA/HybF